MTKLKRYVYSKIILRYVIIAAILCVIALFPLPYAAGMDILAQQTILREHLVQILIVLTGICLLRVYYGMSSVRRTEKRDEISYADLCRDFIVSDSCGPFTIGAKYLYEWSGFALKVYPFSEVIRVYDHVITQNTRYVDENGVTLRTKKQVRHHVEFRFKNRKTIKHQMKENKVNTLMLRLQSLHPEVETGYVDPKEDIGRYEN